MGKRFFNIVIFLLAFTGLSAQNITEVSLVSTPVTCGAIADGTISIEVAGGIGNLNFTLFSGGSVVASSGFIPDRNFTFTGYPKSTDYSIFVADAAPSTGNLFVFTSIEGPDPIKITDASITDINCATVDDGTITVLANGEDNVLLYSLSGPVSTSNSVGYFDLLPTGNYTVTVSHASCPSTYDTTNLFVDMPPLLTVILDNITPTTCFQGNDGSIEITPGGGTPSGIGTGYTYSWTGPGSFSSSSEDIFSLEPGDYSVDVTDLNGCVTSLGPLTVGQASEITLPTVNSSNVSCNGGSNGTATITVAGGSSPYTFSWIGQGTGHSSALQNPIDLIADTYNLSVTDNVGCVVDFIGLIVISEPAALTQTIESKTNVSCFGGSDGTADITISGGTLPYFYSWTSSGAYTSTQEDPSGMPAAVYSLEVTDGNGCVQNFPNIFTITQPNDITAILNGSSDVQCFGGNDGTAQVTVSNGTAPYSYLWTGAGTGHSSSAEDPADLIADTYDLRITDANSCIKIFNDLAVIDQPGDITASSIIVDVDCNGGTTGEIDLTPTGGIAPYSFSWTGPNGYTSTSEDISGLEAGVYDVRVTDANACSKDFINNTVLENTSITASFLVTPLTCKDAGNGAINTTIGGGTPPYIVSWSGDNGYSNAIDEDISSLDAGNYTLTVTDALACVQVFPVQAVTEPLSLAASFIPTNSTCFQSDDGSINVTASGGTAPYFYSWTGPAAFASTNEDISGLAPGSYSLVLSDANGCSITYTNEITLTEPLEISIIPTMSNVTCNGADDGFISIITSGGTPNYTYAWTGPNGFSATSQNISSLEPGAYSLTVSDNNSCIQPFNPVATISEPTAITVTFTAQSNLACFGDSDGTIDIDISGGTLPYVFSWTNSGGTVVSTLEDPVGLPADTYSLTVTDNSLCVRTYPDAIVLTQPTQLLSTLTKTDVVCAGESNGTITISASGGTAPYEYSYFSGGPFTLSNPVSGLSDGTYNIYTRDANGCKTNSMIAISEPELINYEYGVSGQNLCNGDSSVTITISNVTGGVGPFDYSIDGGGTYQLSGVFPMLPGGSYPVVVRDSRLCEQAISALTVLQPDPLKITLYDQDDISTCYDANDGRIAIQGDGGTGVLSYSLNGGATQAIGEFLNLLGGNYTVNMIDENLCRKDTAVILLRPDQLIFDVGTVTDVTGCTGDSNGEITVNAVGGADPKEYSIDGINYQGSGVFSGLIAGDYTITVRDSKMCTEDTSLSISEPLPIVIDTESASPASCNGTSTGQVAVTVSGGTPAYTYSLSPAILPDQNSGTFSGLPAGDYTISVTDSETCTPAVSGTLTVTEAPALLLDSMSVQSISCNGSDDGKIEIFVLGGSLPYEYSIDNEVSYQSTSSYTGLTPGTYDVYARDANGCSVFIDTYVLLDPLELSLTATLKDITPCFGGTNGEISASASGGWNSYEYSIDGLNFTASGDFTGLAAGDYTVFTRDTGNCSASLDVSITEPDEVGASIAKTDYVDEVLGTISISGESGGSPPYEYSIDGLSGSFSSTTSYTDLIAGSYEVVVRDANGCTYEESIQIFDIIPLTIDILSLDVSCFGFDDASIEFSALDAVGVVQYSIDDGATYSTTALFENLKGDSTYLLRAFDEEGKVFFGSEFLAEPLELFIYKDIEPAECNAFSETGSVDLTITGGTGTSSVEWSNGSTTEDLTSLVSGWYVAEITDEAGCFVSDSIYIPALINVTANAGKDTTICSGQTIVLDALPGNIMIWEPSTYLSNPSIANPVAFQVEDSISYVYTVTETFSGKGCYNKDTLNIDILPVYGLEVSQDTVGLKGQSIQIETTTTGEFVSFEWVPASGLNDPAISDPIAGLQNSITYVLLATNDYGCIESDTMIIEVIEDLTVYNVFSPNGDFTNEYFEIENASAFPGILVEVYTRWGSRVFSSTGYSDEKRWDGTFSGKDVPIGTYYYVIIPYPDATPITGNVTIIR